MQRLSAAAALSILVSVLPVARAFANQAPKLDPVEQQLLVADVRLSAAEIRLSRLVARNSSSPAVKQFARTEITNDHILDRQARQIAATTGVKLAVKPTISELQDIQVLAAATPADFDATYLGQIRHWDRTNLAPNWQDQHQAINPDFANYVKEVVSLDQQPIKLP